MMTMNNEIRTLAFERAPTNKVRAAAIAGGMKTLLMDGKLKVLDGKTTAEEIVKVAQIDAATL
jgi:type II secretory ATPase GspE/PulE/Tfp pilus assembly ATPase PilB-like protein